jgi:hypothetical protein
VPKISFVEDNSPAKAGLVRGKLLGLYKRGRKTQSKRAKKKSKEKTEQRREKKKERTQAKTRKKNQENASHTQSKNPDPNSKGKASTVLYSSS